MMRYFMALTSFREWRLKLEAKLPEGKQIKIENKPIVPYETVDQALEAARQRAPELSSLLNSALRQAGNNGYITDTNMFKEKKEILGKIRRKREEGRKDYNIQDLTDILRMSLIMDSKEDADIAAEDLYRKAKWFAFEYKDKPNPKDRLGYHGSYHIDLNIDNMPCEVQIMHKGLSSVKKLAHDQYKVARVGGEIDPSQAAIAAQAFRRRVKGVSPREESGKRLPRREREKKDFRSQD
jgi:hypothetical protein